MLGARSSLTPCPNDFVAVLPRGAPRPRYYLPKPAAESSGGGDQPGLGAAPHGASHRGAERKLKKKF